MSKRLIGAACALALGLASLTVSADVIVGGARCMRKRTSLRMP